MTQTEFKVIYSITQDESLSDGERVDQIAEYLYYLAYDDDRTIVEDLINQDIDIPDSDILDKLADYVEGRLQWKLRFT